MNNNKPSSSKSTIWILVIIAICGLVYFWYSGNSAPAGSTSLDSASADQAAVGVQVLNLLNQIQSLTIDTKIFKDPGFNTLVDYSVMIPPVNVGRPNPFAPLPGFSTKTNAQ